MQLSEIKIELEKANADLERANGALEHLNRQLKTKFESSTVKEAKSILDGLIDNRKKEQAELETKLDDFKEKYPDVATD